MRRYIVRWGMAHVIRDTTFVSETLVTANSPEEALDEAQRLTGIDPGLLVEIVSPGEVIFEHVHYKKGWGWFDGKVWSGHQHDGHVRESKRCGTSPCLDHGEGADASGQSADRSPVGRDS